MSLVNPLLHLSSTFVHGCTRLRCGYRKEPTDSADSRGKLLTSLRQAILIAAAAAVGEARIGHYYNSDRLESLFSSLYDNRYATT